MCFSKYSEVTLNVLSISMFESHPRLVAAASQYTRGSNRAHHDDLQMCSEAPGWHLQLLSVPPFKVEIHCAEGCDGRELGMKAMEHQSHHDQATTH